MSHALPTGKTLAPERDAKTTMSSKKRGLHPNRLGLSLTSCVANINQPQAFEFLSTILLTESGSCTPCSRK
jgi:hypothetical protein